MGTNGRVNGVSAQFIGAQIMGTVNMTVIIYQVSRNLFFHPLQRVFLSPENFLMLLLCKKSGNEPSSLGRCLAGAAGSCCDPAGVGGAVLSRREQCAEGSLGKYISRG